MRRWIAGTIVALILAVSGSLTWSFVQADVSKPVDLDSLLSPMTSIYFRLHGGPEVKKAWEKTAAHGAIVESGLWGFIASILTEENIRTIAEQSQVPADDLVAIYPKLVKIASHINGHGILVGGDIRLLSGEITAIFPDAADSEVSRDIDEFVRSQCQQNGIEVKEQTIEGRKVASFKYDAFFVQWWNEGPHFVVAGNQIGPNPLIRRMAGKSDGLTKSPRYERFKNDKKYTTHEELWIDAELLLKLVPQAVPEVPKVFELFGLKTLQGLKMTCGFEAEAMRTDWDLLLNTPRKGPFALLGEPALEGKKLPKLPLDADYVYASSIDMVKWYDAIVEMIGKGAEIFPDQGLEQAGDIIKQAESELGVKIRDEILTSLGNEVVLYSSPSDGPIFFGFSAAIAVKNAETLRGALNHLAEKIQSISPEVLIDKTEKDGVTYWIGGYAQAGFPLAPTFALSKDWLLITLVAPPAAVRFFEQQKSSEDFWDKNVNREKLFGHSEKVTGVIYSDPRSMVQLTSSFLPLVSAMIRNSLPGFKIDMTSAPRTDVIVKNTFPGIAVITSDDKGIHCSSRYSLPLTNPELGLSPLSVGLGASALLPAIQTARQAVDRTSAMNNLKMLGLALINSHDMFGKFPTGTSQEAVDLPVEDRLSWMADILPFIEEQALFNKLNKKEAWDSETNKVVTDTSIRAFLNPELGGEGTNDTHFVGMAGVGENAAELPANDPKAGIFGYNRVTKFHDIKDGASNTIAIIGVNEKIGPWGKGGPSTVRGLSEQPYIGGPDGFGGSTNGGVQVMMADGSVRFLAKDIDPAVLEKLATKAGGEEVEVP